MLKQINYKIFSLILVVLMVGCNANSSNELSSDDDFVIYTSIYPIEFVAKQIVGEHATVKSVYPPGVDAHTYEPTSKEITDIARGDAFFYLGAGMESFAENMADTLSTHDILFIELGENEQLFLKDEEHEHDDHEHSHGDYDPHIWLDPLRMIAIGEIMVESLIELDPENEATFLENFEQLEENLLTLDEEFLTTLENKQMKKLIVSHGAYGYWEERYGIEQIPISGLSSTDEPSQKELTEIVKLAEKEQLHFVIFEQTGSSRLAEIIRENIDAEKLFIHNLEVLTDDDVKNGEDYFSIMRKNLQTLDEATN